MRKIQNIAFVLLAALSVSCINDHMEPTLCRDGELTLNFTTRSLDTRVEGTNDDVNPVESIVHDLQYFLYKKDSGDEAEPLAAGVITGITDNEIVDGDGPTGDEDPGDRFSKTVSIDATALQKLCPNEGDECEIYVIANLLENGGIDLTKDLANATRKNLKATNLTSDFANPTSLKSFVMDSEGTDDLVKRGTDNNANKLSNTEAAPVYLTRAAAKIMIELKIQTAVDTDNATWIPVTDVTTSNPYSPVLNFYSGVKEGVIDNGSDEDNDVVEDIVATTANPYYNKETIQMIGGTVGGNGAVDTTNTSETVGGKEFKTFVSMDNIYSYTSAWDDTASDAPTFKLTIYWKKQTDEGETWVAYDYTVPVNLKTNQLVRNKLYLIRLTIGALGELSDLSEYEYSYQVLDWVGQGINAELSRPQYLVVEKNYVVMNNVETISVGYQSSDNVKVTYSSTIGKPNYAVYTQHNVEVSNGQIIVNHNLDNVRSVTDKTYDYLPQTFTVRVEHENNPDMYEIITFVQYPALYYIVDPGDLDENNYVMINDNRSYSSKGASSGNILYWESVGTSSTGFSSLYEINVSAFDETTAEYLVADPRVPSNTSVISTFPGYNRESGQSSIPDADVEEDATGDSVINGYRRTITGEAADYLVAPSFIIASACGTYRNGDSRIYAETSGLNRCAAYQEWGYPAGRWRIPTPAELNVVGRLCAEGKIPETIFYDNVIYMSSNGPYKYSKSDGTFTVETSQTYSGSIRCLYDTWYWKDRCADYSQFIWGAEGDNLEQKRKDGYLVPIK